MLVTPRMLDSGSSYIHINVTAEETGTGIQIFKETEHTKIYGNRYLIKMMTPTSIFSVPGTTTPIVARVTDRDGKPASNIAVDVSLDKEVFRRGSTYYEKEVVSTVSNDQGLIQIEASSMTVHLSFDILEQKVSRWDLRTTSKIESITDPFIIRATSFDSITDSCETTMKIRLDAIKSDFLMADHNVAVTKIVRGKVIEKVLVRTFSDPKFISSKFIEVERNPLFEENLLLEVEDLGMMGVFRVAGDVTCLRKIKINMEPVSEPKKDVNFEILTQENAKCLLSAVDESVSIYSTFLISLN